MGRWVPHLDRAVTIGRIGPPSPPFLRDGLDDHAVRREMAGQRRDGTRVFRVTNVGVRRPGRGTPAVGCWWDLGDDLYRGDAWGWD